ncbi:damage-inducible protein DinB [Deinococcus puniceus]|uniref:Damage-inducible protein DinB n=2 Tax=Deinococcus puniceus TaxID=1182568 RepID=A0A172TDA2_9DEIO|nr:damage-inducible protein DinB [Deinococcus puniceus]
MGAELAGALAAAVEAENRVNDVLCGHLTPEMMDAQTPGGGMTVAQHLAHMAGSTKFWLAQLDGDAAQPLPVLYDETKTDAFVAQGDPARAAAVMREVWTMTLHTATAATSPGNLPHPSPAQFVLHMLGHTAYHRGQIALALKVGGFPLPDANRMWGPLRGDA